jgi:hypothetical protein
MMDGELKMSKHKPFKSLVPHSYLYSWSVLSEKYENKMKNSQEEVSAVMEKGHKGKSGKEQRQGEMKPRKGMSKEEFKQLEEAIALNPKVPEELFRDNHSALALVFQSVEDEKLINNFCIFDEKEGLLYLEKQTVKKENLGMITKESLQQLSKHQLGK